jgi:hypothetical protein
MKTVSNSRVFGHFRELGLEAVRRGHSTFTFDPLVYVDLCRQGFSVRDELEAFCQLSGSTFWPNKDKMSATVRVPDGVFQEYWMDRLSDTLDDMERYG